MRLGIHNATLNSDRLKPVYELLRSRGSTGATSREVAEVSNTLNPNTTVAELRKVIPSNTSIECELERETETGRRVYRYTLVGTPEPVQKSLFGEEPKP